MLKADERAGRLVVGGAAYDGRRCRAGAAVRRAYAIDVVSAPEAMRPALARFLDRVAVVPISTPPPPSYVPTRHSPR